MGDRDRQFRIVTYNSQTNTRPTPHVLLLEELYALLEHEETDCRLADGAPGCIGKKCSLKDGLAWSGGLIANPCTCDRSTKGKVAGRCVRCGGKTRLAANVDSLEVAIIDIDAITEQQRDEMCENLEGVELYLHTTHTHAPPIHNFRLVLPLARPVTPAEWEQLWFAIIRKFKLPEDNKKHGVDKSTRDPARLSFLPRAFRGAPFINVHQPGVLLDPDELLKENMRFSRAARLVAPTQGPTPEAGSIDLKDLRGFLRRFNPDDNDPSFDAEQQKGAIIRRVIDEEPLAQKGFRGLTMLRAGTLVGFLLPPYTPVEAAMELLRPSISKTPSFDDDDPDKDSIEAWLADAQRGYEKAQQTKADDLAGDQGAVGKLHTAIQKKKASPVPDSKPAPRPSVPIHFPVPPVGVVDDDEDWRLKLDVVIDKKGVSRTRNTFANLLDVMRKHKAWQSVIRYNEISNEPEALGGPIPEAERDPDRLITAIRFWMDRQEGLEMPASEIEAAVLHIAYGNRFDPVKSYLLGLVWDGVPRIHTWLERYCGARLSDDNGHDVTKYVRMVGEKWLIAGAARGLYPGCKADNVLIFEGKQNVGKSKTLGILGGEWFADTRLNLSDKSTLELTAKSWIIEMSELATMKKSETETQKAFFSTKADNFRLSYARRVGKYKRRCIFAGTTNETRYLLDPTGNRRFWSVWCQKYDTAALRRDVDQLWAEAVVRARAGETCPNCPNIEERCAEHRWWLDENQTAIAEVVSVSRLKSDFVDVIRSWWFSKVPKHRPEKLTTLAVLRDVLGLPVDKLEAHQSSIGRAMSSLGFVKTHLVVPGGREWAYLATPQLLTAPQWVLNPSEDQKLQFELNRKKAEADLAAATQPAPGAVQ